MRHNEHDAARAMRQTAELRMLRDDPLELTQRMPVADRRYRQHEGRHMHETARGLGHARAMVNNPVYRNQEIAAGLREPMESDLHYRRRVWEAHAIAQRQHCTQFDIDIASGYSLDVLGQKYGILRTPLDERVRWPDFRDNRREYRLLPHEIAQQDGFPDNE